MYWKLLEIAEFAGIALFGHENECVCPYTIFVFLTVIVLIVSIGIGAYFAYKYMDHVQKTAAKDEQ